MSRSWASEVGSDRARTDPATNGQPRGQVEPFAALAAVLAVGLAISLYAGVLAGADPGGSERTVAETALDRVSRHVSDGSVVAPDRIPQSPAVAPAGYEANVTLAVEGTEWRAGPTPPESADRASRRVTVRLAPGKVRPGRLTVVVWS